MCEELLVYENLLIQSHILDFLKCSDKSCWKSLQDLGTYDCKDVVTRAIGTKEMHDFWTSFFAAQLFL